MIGASELLQVFLHWFRETGSRDVNLPGIECQVSRLWRGNRIYCANNL